MRRSKRLLIMAVPAAVLVAAAALAFFSAQRAIDGSARAARAGHQLAFTLSTIDLAVAPAQNTAFEPVVAPSSFTSGAFLEQTLYLAGPSGLSIYAPDGTLRRSLRAGYDLPVEPIVAVASAHLRGASEPQILLATAGAGLLLLTPTPTGAPGLSQLLPALPAARDLTALLALPSGDLLIGTRHAGLLRYNGSALIPFELPGGGALEITALAAPDTASFLIGTRASGLFYVHGGTVQHTDTSTGLPDRQIESLLVAGSQAFAGTPLGVAQFDLAQFDLNSEAFRPSRVLARGLFAHALAYDAATNRLLAGTLDQSVQPIPLDVATRLRNASITAPRDAAEPAPAQRIDAFLSAPGTMFALADGALIRRTGTTWTAALLPTPATLTDRNISALAFAPDGSLYVGFFDHGIDIISPGRPIRHLEDDHLFCINRLALDPERQTIAAATANGLVLFDREGTPRQTLTRRDGLISDHVTDLAFTRSGLTLATPAGLTFMTPTGAESLYAFQGLVNNHVYTLGARPDSSQLLAGTLGGISILDSNSVHRNLTATNSGLKHNWITALLPLPANAWLIGTYGAGLQQLAADGSFRLIDLPAGTPRDLIINPNALLATSGHIYAGTLDHGMLVYSTASGRWSNITGGLPSLNVTAFAARNGELYIGTENGLVRIAETTLEAQLQ